MAGTDSQPVRQPVNPQNVNPGQSVNPSVNLGQTLIFKAPAEARGLAAAAPAGGKAKPAKPVELIQGSTPDFTSEMNSLLRDRLRQATLVLSAGYVIFFLKNLLVPASFTTDDHGLWLWGMAVAGVITGVVAQRLCAHCHMVLNHLRRTETVVFLTSATYLFFAGMLALRSAGDAGMIPAGALPWVVLIFTYALFIPNTWQRAMWRVVPLAAAPLIAVAVVEWMFPQVRQSLRNHPGYGDFLLETVLIMVLAATVAIWGVRSIGTLRSEAFQSRQMGQYRLKHLLGRGGMGEVYLAEHLMLKRPCAIKLIRPNRAGDPHALARFEQEVQAMARLTHWNTVEIYDYGRTDDGTFYYVMEYLPGMNLDQLVEMHGAMPASRVIHLLTQACDALAEAHGIGLIHRDIKPGNIFAAVRGGQYDVAKLLDFGLVRNMDQSADARLTQEKMVTGSPLYLSPEQARGDVADERSDIYSLGCVLYFLLTGRPPFEEDHPVKLILAHAQQSPQLPSHILSDVPRDLEAVIMKCMEKDPRDRFASVVELRHALQDCHDAGIWTSQVAHDWWTNYGCPRKKQLDRCVCEGRDYDSLTGDPDTESAEMSLAGARS